MIAISNGLCNWNGLSGLVSKWILPRKEEREKENYITLNVLYIITYSILNKLLQSGYYYYYNLKMRK